MLVQAMVVPVLPLAVELELEQFEVGLKLGANDSHSGCTSTNAVAFVVLE